MKNFIFLWGIVAVILVVGCKWLRFYWRKRRKEEKKRQKLLEELAPWCSSLSQMNDEEFEKEFKRISRLSVRTKENARRLQLQFDLVCEEDLRRRKSKYQSCRHFEGGQFFNSSRCR